MSMIRSPLEDRTKHILSWSHVSPDILREETEPADFSQADAQVGILLGGKW